MEVNIPESSSPPRLTLRPWQGLIVGLVAGTIAWALVDRLHPVFLVPKEYDVPNLGAPPEKFAAARAAQNRADRFNAMLNLAIVGSLLAGGLALLTGIQRRSAIPPLIGLPLGALGGAAGGLSGSLVQEFWVQTAIQPELVHTLGLQLAALTPLGIGTGLALGAALASVTMVRTTIPMGLLAGALAGVLYPVAVSFLLPAAGTESLVPAESGTRLLWIGLTTALSGSVIPTGLVRAHS